MIAPTDILALRKRLNLTQAELARSLGVNTMTVWRWEKYGPPQNGTARALIERLADEAAQ